jgi:hypothetical protein
MRKLLLCLAALMLVDGALVGGASAFPSGGALPPALTLVVQVAGLNGVPDDAVGVAMNVTATGPAAPGYLTVYPCGDVPTASNLNYRQDQTVPNFVVSALSPAGEVCIDTYAVTDVVVDLAGYLPASSPIVMLPQPARIVDSRQGVGLPGPMIAGQVAEVQVAGMPGIPADASSVLFNATVTNTATPGFLTVFPCGESIPPTSTLNYKADDTVPNFVVAKIGSAGRVCLYSTSATHVIIDVAGYNPAGATDVVPLQSPARLLDTRTGIGGPPGKVTGAGRSVQLAGNAAIPGNATGVVVNLTATQSTASGFVSAFPCGGTTPLVSNLNFTAGTDVANMAIVKLGAGQLCLTSNSGVDVIADVTGYLRNDASITALTPMRIYDSREGVDPLCNVGVRMAPNGFEIVDLKTGAVTGLAPLTGVASPLRVHVAADCQHIEIAGFVQGSDVNWWVFDRSGQLITSAYLTTQSENAMLTDQGPIVLRYRFDLSPPSWDVTDFISGQVLFSLPQLEPFTDGGVRLRGAVGATTDGGLIALSHPSIDRQRQTVTYWTPDGVELGEWTVPVGAFNLRLSPAGTYVAYAISGSTGRSNGFVVALDGSPVATMPSNILGVGPWISDGSMLTCTNDNTLGQWPARWDLFSPVKNLVPGNPYKACLTAAR